MKLDAFGTLLEIKRRYGSWAVFYVGNEGKKRKADGIEIPNDISEEGIVGYISDLMHERARPNHMEVKRIG